MGQVIASTYEVIKEIGSGGGGVVYLGKHLRLDKLVVLKADKRKLSTKPEVLRREVDALKGLSHTYIPQVYDFVQENGVVYTVMDYIEGESLDKSLKRGEQFEQARVIKWSCQLLDALIYLHSRPPYGILHSDIKPANIMLTPEDDIRLIDFNIALALGEEGAVRVGYSQGYASPEHYGLDYSGISSTHGIENPKTKLPADPAATLLSTRAGSSDSSGSRMVMLDVRSDIYSLGATLYHVLTGRHPAQDAKNVKPISADDDVSPAVAMIINKAMQPNPDDRYQTAREMLRAFEDLYDSDPRSKRFKRHAKRLAILLTSLFLVGGAMSFSGLRIEQKAEAVARAEAEKQAEIERIAKENERIEKEKEQNAKDALEQISLAQEALKIGDIKAAKNLSLNALERNTQYNTQAQKTLTDALGVYDLSDGFKAYLVLELPSEPLKVTLSPEGTRLAAIYAWNVAIFDTESGEKLIELPVEQSALSDVIFLDENKIAYAASDGLAVYDLKDGVLWTGEAATSIVSSAGGNWIAVIYKDSGECKVYNTATGQIRKTVNFEGKHQRVASNTTFADPGDNLLALSADGEWLAVSLDEGGLYLYNLEHEDNDVEIFDESEYKHFEGGFCGDYFAFCADSGKEAEYTLVSLSPLGVIGSMSASTPFHLQVNETGIYLANENLLVEFDPETFDQTELAYTERDIAFFQHGEAYTITIDENGAASVFDRAARQLGYTEFENGCDFAGQAGNYAFSASRDTPVLRLQKLESHEQNQILRYDPSYEHTEARISADTNTVMLFQIDKFYLFDMQGNLLTEIQIPNPGKIYDQQYKRDASGSYLEITYYDGYVLEYSAADGTLIGERQKDRPDESLYEEFVTDRLRITAPLHETPVAYNKNTGEVIRELEKDAYLTYVSQVGDYVVTEYISAQGTRYGILLDENCDTIAYLPYLCDVVNDQLIFDYPSGELRTSRIYSTQELIALAK